MSLESDPLERWLQEPPPGGVLDYKLILWRLREVENEQKELALAIQQLMTELRDAELSQLRTGEHRAFTMRTHKPAWTLAGIALLLQVGTFIVLLVDKT